MYRLIKENVEVEQGLYADLLMDGDSVELAVSPGPEPTIYLIPMDELVQCAGANYERGKMCRASYKVFEQYNDYCKWFNQNVN
jgi:hypothetical protein